MQELLKHESDDEHAAEAVALFCYVAKKFIGAFAAVLGGLDTLVFTAGIGENAPRIRQLICQGLGFLGVYLDEMRNTSNSPVISTDGSPVCLRIIPTNEELMLARHAREVIRRTTPVSISGT
jgi:acetate kinase